MNTTEPPNSDHIIKDALQESLRINTQLLNEQVPFIARLARIVVQTFTSGNKVILFGNGGSAADAQHIAAEFVNRLNLDREALPAIALTTDMSILTSVSNDSAFDQVFARQVQALVGKGDLVVGLSTSGNSPNVLQGVLAAKEKEALTMGFTGFTGGKLKYLVDYCFCVPSGNTTCIQEASMTVWHAICEVVEVTLFTE